MHGTGLMIGLVSKCHNDESKCQKPPVLFVPGAFCGAWVWQDTFMRAFYNAGHDVYAFSFRGHGRASWRISLNRLDTFIEDLQSALTQIPQKPIVVAHSMGGFVTLKLLEMQKLPGAMLLSPVPPSGLFFSLLSLGLKSPISVFKLLCVSITPLVTVLGAPPLGIYSKSSDPAKAKEITGQLQAESLLALAELMRPGQIDPKKISTPLHLFGAEGDHIVPPGEVRRAAMLLNAPVTIYPGMSHTYQAEKNWRNVANDMLAWVEKLGADKT